MSSAPEFQEATHKHYIQDRFSSDMFKLDGKVAIITGGSRGIGMSIAEVYASLGARVAITSRNEDQVKEAVELIAKNAGVTAEDRIIGFKSDATDREDTKKLVNAVISKWGRLDIIVPNTATMRSEPVSTFEIDIENEFIPRLVQNLQGTLYLCQEAFPYIKKSENGRIIVISSIFGQTGGKAAARFGAYPVSKAAQVYLTRMMAQEVPGNVTVNALCPGPTDTQLLRDVYSQDYMVQWGYLNPQHRIAHVRDIAGMAAYLASNVSAHVNGDCQIVDGGWMSAGQAQGKLIKGKEGKL